jgi:hypothetical protein
MENNSMQRPSADEYAASYQKYFDRVPEDDYLSLLRPNLINTINRLEKNTNRKT